MKKFEKVYRKMKRCDMPDLDNDPESIYRLDAGQQSIVFAHAAASGYYAVAKALYETGNVDTHFGNDYAFRMACIYGNLFMARWLYGLGGVDIHAEMDHAFVSACSKGQTRIVKWLYGLDTYAKGVREEGFVSAYLHGHFDTVKWLDSTGDVDLAMKRRDNPDWDNYNYDTYICVIIADVCAKGHLDFLKWFNNAGYLDDIALQSMCFHYAYACNHLNIVQWLYEQKHFDIHSKVRLCDEKTYADFSFVDACSKGNLEFAQWVYTTSHINQKQIRMAFYSACSHGHTDVAKWLYSISNTNIREKEISYWLHDIESNKSEKIKGVLLKGRIFFVNIKNHSNRLIARKRVVLFLIFLQFCCLFIIRTVGVCLVFILSLHKIFQFICFHLDISSCSLNV